MSCSTKSLMLLILSLLCTSNCIAQLKADIVQGQGEILSDLSQKVDANARYLFYLHGRIVEQSRRPTHPQFGIYEYDQILDTLKQHGFVVISEQRRKDTEVEGYAKKVAGQVRQLLEAGVPAAHVTVVGASQGSFMAMLASTYLKNRRLNFVFIAGCAADDGFLQLVDLHGKVLFISEQTDRPGSCQRFRADATGLGEYKELHINTGQRHGFLYRPLKEWVEPTIAWAQGRQESAHRTNSRKN